MRSSKLLATLALVGLAGSGCATILQGSRQNVDIVTSPSAASIQVDGLRIGNSPAIVHLKRGRTHLITINKSGYQELTFPTNSSAGGGWVVLDLVCGIVPLVVDIATRNWESFDTPMYRTLSPVGAGNAIADHGDSTGAGTQPSVTMDAQTGQVVLADRSRTQLFGDSTLVICNLTGRRTTELELTFAGPLLASNKPLGPFTMTAIKKSPGDTFYVSSNRGRVFRMKVLSLSSKQATLEWTQL